MALEYACWGLPPASAPTLVLLHEGLGSVAQWKDLPQKLASATGCGVFAYSRAGYGQSDPTSLPRPLHYMSDEALRVLPEVLDLAGIRQCILMGHSDGATIAAIHAGTQSDLRVRGLILIAPHFFAEPLGLAAIKAAGEAFEKGDLRRRLARYHAHVDNAFNGWHGAWTDPRFADWNVADVIDHWRIPALAIQSREDPYGSLAQIREIEDRIYAPLETCLLSGNSHAPHLDHPKDTLAAIEEFCARLLRLERQKVPLVG